MAEDVTQILNLIESGDTAAAERLLPVVYAELRKLAAARLANEKPGQTLQATALVHEAYLRLVRSNNGSHWNGRGHFFGAAAEAMPRILIEQARKKKSLRAGGDKKRIELSAIWPATGKKSIDLLALDEALEQLDAHDHRACKIVKLRFFSGLTVPQTAEVLNVSVSTVENDWVYAKSWLKRQLRSDEDVI